MSLASLLVHSNPELIAKITGGIYGDYDYSAGNQASINGHYSDKGKLPNHPTFSNESMYSSDKYSGGQWSQDKKGRDVFTPSVDMVQGGATDGLAEYFKKVEPNGVLQAPAPYSNSIFKGK